LDPPHAQHARHTPWQQAQAAQHAIDATQPIGYCVKRGAYSERYTSLKYALMIDATPELHVKRVPLVCRGKYPCPFF
jgi:hypothetical protein